jgi:hypothetical protein
VRALRSIFRPKREEGTGGWRKICKEELYSLFSSKILLRDQIKEDEMNETYRTREEMRNI